MKTISVNDAQSQLAGLIDELNEGPVLLLRKGRPCAALIGLGERFNREAFSLGRNKRLRKLMDDACRRAKKSGGVPFAEIVAEVEKQSQGRRMPPRPRGSKS
jgi:antitoxin (DNA-binding transcriptional repressor) of toxin-antitoxin stability system